MKFIQLLFAFALFSQTAFAAEVLFRVDMNEVSDPFTTPEVNGTFNNWCGNCAPMTDDDQDGVWELVISLDPGFYEYKFSYDNWNGQETLLPGSACTLTTGQFTNRVITVTGDVELPVVCFGACEACGEGPQLSLITFRVDMNDFTGTFTTPEVNGTFNGWCGGCAPMSDDDADGVWELDILIEGSSAEYKFAFDNWTGQESLTPGSPCTITTDNFTNRYIELSGDEVLPIVCWESCEACGTINVEEVKVEDVRLYPNPATDMTRIDLNGFSASQISVIDLAGHQLFDVQLNGARNYYDLDVKTFPNGVYFIRVQNKDQVLTKKLIVG